MELNTGWILQFLQNVCLFAAIVFCYREIIRVVRNERQRILLLGLMFGASAIVGALLPVAPSDRRSVRCGNAADRLVGIVRRASRGIHHDYHRRYRAVRDERRRCPEPYRRADGRWTARCRFPHDRTVAEVAVESRRPSCARRHARCAADDQSASSRRCRTGRAGCVRPALCCPERSSRHRRAGLPAPPRGPQPDARARACAGKQDAGRCARIHERRPARGGYQRTIPGFQPSGPGDARRLAGQQARVLADGLQALSPGWRHADGGRGTCPAPCLARAGDQRPQRGGAQPDTPGRLRGERQRPPAARQPRRCRRRHHRGARRLRADQRAEAPGRERSRAETKRRALCARIRRLL